MINQIHSEWLVSIDLRLVSKKLKSQKLSVKTQGEKRLGVSNEMIRQIKKTSRRLDENA